MSTDEKKQDKYVEVYEYDDLADVPFDGKYRILDEQMIKYMTARVRKTIEYRNLVDYMKKTMNINTCSFYKDYSMGNGFTIELHHAPFCLFDYVESVARKHFDEDKDDPHFQPWRVEEEVNRLHYEFVVGLIPVNPTAHQLIHSGNLKLHPRMVEGNWRRFLSDYDEYISDAVRGKAEEFIALAKTNPDEIPEIVKYRPVMISNLKFKSLGDIDLQQLIVEKLKERFIENNG